MIGAGTRASAQRWGLLALALLSACMWSTHVEAAGDEYSLRGDDLQVTVSTKWAGCSSGGYFPIRILVQNRGVDCTASFVFAGEQDGLASARRTLTLAQNATVKFTLPVPCVGTGTYGKLTVTRNGRAVEALSQTLSIPDRHAGGAVRPALLVISPRDVDFDPFEAAVVSTQPHATSPAYGGYGYHGAARENHERIEPTILPEEWIAYSGLDLVALSLKTLEAMTSTERAALLKWVQTGGSLMVYEVGATPAESQQLGDLLQMGQHAAVSPTWQSADPSGRRVIPIVETDSYGNVIAHSAGGATVEVPAESQPEAGAAPFLWPAEPDTFAARDLMLGHVYAFRESPFPGTPHDWAWFLSSVPEDARRWTMRHGISARYGTDEFLQFLIPSVRGVPVIPFLLLITLFTIVIGPLNYIFLWRRRRLYLLLVTIPLIALGTSLALFGYSAVAHGFATRSRARTLTYVDQSARSAVTMARIALYAGLAPSDGLRFSADTMVMPIWPDGHDFDSATTDWTEQQNLRSGWLDSRTRTQFLTLGHRDERGRLEIASAGEMLQVTNGFEWDLEALVVCEHDGRLFYADQLPAGGSKELVKFEGDLQQQFRERLDRHAPSAPAVTDSGGWFNWDLGRYTYGYDPSNAVSFNSGRLEQLIGQIKRQQSGPSAIPPGSYAAVVSENPGVELGVDRTRPQASLHLLMGRY